MLIEVAAVDQQEVRSHVAQLLRRLPSPRQQRREAVVILQGFLDDDSRIVRTFAMQAIADLAEGDEQLRGRMLPLLAELTRMARQRCAAAAASCSPASTAELQSVTGWRTTVLSRSGAVRDGSVR